MLRFSILAACLWVGLISSLALAQQSGRQQNFNRLLKRQDKNGDGKLSREEWAKKPKAFDRLDANHDGFLTRDEAEAAFKQQAGRREKHGQAFMDQNHDGNISRAEWTGKPKAFDRLDLNRDGVISREELKAHHHGNRQRPGSASPSTATSSTPAKP